MLQFVHNSLLNPNRVFATILLQMSTAGGIFYAARRLFQKAEPKAHVPPRGLVRSKAARMR
jgi:hypothetical protein